MDNTDVDILSQEELPIVKSLSNYFPDNAYRSLRELGFNIKSETYELKPMLEPSRLAFIAERTR